MGGSLIFVGGKCTCLLLAGLAYIVYESGDCLCVIVVSASVFLWCLSVHDISGCLCMIRVTVCVCDCGACFSMIVVTVCV